MYPVAWDTETALIAPALQAPPIVCVSAKHDGGEALMHWTEAKPFFKELFDNPDITHVGHNIAFDFSVVAQEWPEFLPRVFDAYERGKVRDTMIRAKLLDIAMGCYRGYNAPLTKRELEAEEKKEEKARKKGKYYERKKGKWVKLSYDLNFSYNRATGKWLDKDTWRLRYGEFRNVPLSEWPEGARHYPLEDARATYEVFRVQDDVRKDIAKSVRRNVRDIANPDPLGDEESQVKHAFWIYLMKAAGIRTDGERIAKLEGETKETYEWNLGQLYSTPICSRCGAMFVRLTKDGPEACLVHQRRYAPWTLVRHTGKRHIAAARLRMEYIMGGKENCRLTETGEISLDEEACKLSGDTLLEEYAAISSLQTVLKKDIPALLLGTDFPVHSNFDSLLATGRTSSSSPNIQNIRRLPGIRECFVPRKGKVFLNADYDGLELRTLAQVCLKLLGRSKLADVLNDLHGNNDPHLSFAASMFRLSYEEAKARYEAKDPEVGRARQFGKIANFGFPGGLGYEALILFGKRTTGIVLSMEEAIQLKEDWLQAFPEMEHYFDYINSKCRQQIGENDNLATIEQLFTKRIRGKIRYTVACNTLFQGLGSDATKNAGWLITKACFLDESSPLYGCRIVNFVHDEFIVECLEERAHEACMELQRLMIEGAAPYLPGVPPKISKPLVARCWSKDAEQVWARGGKKPADENDRLVPWELAA